MLGAAHCPAAKIRVAHVVPFGSCSPVALCSRPHARWAVRCQTGVLTAGAAVGTGPIDAKVLLTACLHPKLGIAFKAQVSAAERVAGVVRLKGQSCYSWHTNMNVSLAIESSYHCLCRRFVPCVVLQSDLMAWQLQSRLPVSVEQSMESIAADSHQGSYTSTGATCCSALHSDLCIGDNDVDTETLLEGRATGSRRPIKRRQLKTVAACPALKIRSSASCSTELLPKNTAGATAA